jgi:hypothetical protein
MSILAVDFGSVNTRAVLIDMVDGVYQLIARAQTRTTDGFPVADVNVGLDRVLRDLSDATGRTFTTGDGRILMPERDDRSGVDHFTATASIGRPLRAVIVGLVPDISAASALRAAAGTYVDIAAAIHLDDGRDEEARLNAILLNNPDVILIAGGTEQGAESAVLEMVALVRLAVLLIVPERRPIIIYAGNSQLYPRINTVFEGVTKVLLAPNLRPMLNDEALDSAKVRLAQAFDLYKEQRSQDFSVIASMSKNGVSPTAQGYPTIVQYLGQSRKTNVIAVDIGSAASVLTACINGETTSAIRTDLGLGHNALNLVDSVDTALIRKWLPFNITKSDLMNYAANKMLRPASVPAALRDAYIEHAMLKAAIQTLLTAARPTWKDRDASQFGVIIGAGSALHGVGDPAYTALLILDALQPTGITTIYSDPFALVPALGSIVNTHPETVVQVLDGNNLELIGTSFSLSGTPRLDKPALRVKITLADGLVIEETVRGGHLWVYPLPIGETAKVRVRVVGRGLSLGGKRRWRMQVEGSAAGLVFDARGRMLTMAEDVRVRSTQMPMWVGEVTGSTPLEIDPRWLYDMEPEHIAADKARKAEQSRRGLFRWGRTPVTPPEEEFIIPDDFPEDDELEGVRPKSNSRDRELREELKGLRDASLS